MISYHIIILMYYTCYYHIDRTLCPCAQSVYALKTLRVHGVNADCINNVFNACQTHVQWVRIDWIQSSL